MNQNLHTELVRRLQSAEALDLKNGSFRQLFHLMPPVGWLNDPNGLCQLDGVFHFYFQYAPESALGALKFWGHSISTDMLSWEYVGCPLLPDEAFDRNGVYSGNALVEDGLIKVFYTGNAKKHDRSDYDYVNAGREANTVYAESADGQSFSAKELLMTNDDYPDDLTCHVRDPFVWKATDGLYYMLQGARKKVAGPTRPTRFPAAHGEGACRDVGEVLLFSSSDLKDWTLANRITTPERFGFMWECPGYVRFDDGSQLLSVSPQGLEGERWERGNIYQSGYFPLSGDIAKAPVLGEFRLWDAGFDFYAPQIFTAEDGRHVLVGWMGIPDEPSYGNDPTVEAGWQHCFTVPRELSVGEGGVVLQQSVRELAEKRADEVKASGKLHVNDLGPCYDVEVSGISDEFKALVNRQLLLSYLPAADGLPARFEMRFVSKLRSSAGCGRDARWEPLDELNDLRIVADASSVEVFANGGALVMSTRMYPSDYALSVEAAGAEISCWKLAMA